MCIIAEQKDQQAVFKQGQRCFDVTYLIFDKTALQKKMFEMKEKKSELRIKTFMECGS